MASRPRASKVRRARRVVTAFAAGVACVNIALAIGMDTIAPSLRDGEYVSRRGKIQSRVLANPDRPLAVILGSSRTAIGIRPLADDRGPLVCNASQVGAGPILELLTLRRLLHDGVVPKTAIIEYWPPFLSGEGGYSEFARLDPHRYFPSDEPFIRDYLPHPRETLKLMREIRRMPVWNHRLRLMGRLLPSWLPQDQRLDWSWTVDAAGWMQGASGITPADRSRHLLRDAAYYQPLLADLSIAPVAERALREILSICRSRGIAATVIWMPESAEFRGWYAPAAIQKSEALLATVTNELHVPVIMARDWMPNDAFADGYHLSSDGASAFTHRLMDELAK